MKKEEAKQKDEELEDFRTQDDAYIIIYDKDGGELYVSKQKTIKKAVEEEFKVKVDNVNIVITQKGDKKAFVKLNEKFSASDIASRMGML